MLPAVLRDPNLYPGGRVVGVREAAEKVKVTCPAAPRSPVEPHTALVFVPFPWAMLGTPVPASRRLAFRHQVPVRPVARCQSVRRRGGESTGNPNGHGCEARGTQASVPFAGDTASPARAASSRRDGYRLQPQSGHRFARVRVPHRGQAPMYRGARSSSPRIGGRVRAGSSGIAASSLGRSRQKLQVRPRVC